jgi:chromosome segregation ATPase
MRLNKGWASPFLINNQKTGNFEANEALVDWAKRSGEKSGTATSENVVENSEKLTELKNKRDAFGAAYVAMKKNPNTPTEALSSMEKNLMDVGEQIKKLEEPPEQAKVEQISAVNPLGEMATKATNENNELTRTGQGVEVAPPVVSMNNKAISIGGETMMAEVTIRTEEDTMDRLVSRMMRPV